MRLAEDRRQAPRIGVVRGGEGCARATIPIHVHDVSEGGLLFESSLPLRPKAVCDLQFDLEGLAIGARVSVLRCQAADKVPDGNGGTSIRYRTAGTFVSLGDVHREALRAWIDLHTDLSSIPEAFLSIREPQNGDDDARPSERRGRK